MSKLTSWLLANVFVAVALCVRISLANDAPSQIFSINSATVGVTTLDEVRETYGMIKPSRVGPEDEADVMVCYTYPSPKGESFLIFESSIMGDFKRITGFRISTLRPSGNCVSTKIDVSALVTRNGVRVGQKLEDFKKAVSVEFKHCGFALTYEALSRRAATQEELKRLRAKWPNEKQDYFDVTSVIRAKFRKNKLIDLYVHKIESY